MNIVILISVIVIIIVIGAIILVSTSETSLQPPKLSTSETSLKTPKLLTSECSKKQDLNTFCVNPDLYIDCPSFLSPNPVEMLIGCVQQNPDKILTNVKAYNRARNKILQNPDKYNQGNNITVNSTTIPDVKKIPNSDCNLVMGKTGRETMNVFCNDPDKYVNCSNTYSSFNSLNILQSCLYYHTNPIARKDENIEFNLTSQKYNTALDLLDNPSSLPSSLPTFVPNRINIKQLNISI